MELSAVPLSKKLEDVEKRPTETKCIIRQTMTALGPIITTVTAGMTSGYSAILLPQLQSGNSTTPNRALVNMTDYLNMNQLTVTGTDEESWVAASAALAMAPGCWIAGIIMEKFGRRGAYLIVSPVYFAAWLMVGLAPNILWLLIGRTICGICSGLNGPLSPVYMAEISDPSLRGIFLSGISLGIATGVMLSQVFGTWLHWRLSALLCGLFPALCFVFVAIAPESPTWLMKRNKSAKARKAWVYLRGEYCDQEFEALKTKSANTDAIDDEKDEEKPLETKSAQERIHQNSSTPTSWITTITSRSFLMPFCILNVFFFVSQFSGANAIVFYSVNMLVDVAGRENAYMATLVLNFIRIIFSILACWFTRKYRRRSLIFVSEIGTIISLFLLSGALFIELGKPWLPICFLLMYMCFISIGLVPLPWLLCGELFLPSMRGLGSGLSSSLCFIFFFIVVKTAPAMMEDSGAPWAFAFYGIIIIPGSIFLYYYLPETKDKTLNEISECFAKSKQGYIPKAKIFVSKKRQS